MISKHLSYARDVVKKYFGKSDKLKMNRRVFEKEIAHTYLNGMIEMSLVMILEDKFQKFETLEELKGHMRFLYSKMINHFNSEYVRNPFIHHATIEELEDEFDNLELYHDTSGMICWKYKNVAISTMASSEKNIEEPQLFI